jgi:hypothetical protein
VVLAAEARPDARDRGTDAFRAVALESLTALRPRVAEDSARRVEAGEASAAALEWVAYAGAPPQSDATGARPGEERRVRGRAGVASRPPSLRLLSSITPSAGPPIR